MDTADSGADLWDQIWLELGRGVVDRRHGFHAPVLVTISPEGMPEARMVVLRKVKKSSLHLCCHTDVRSPKVVSIRQNPKICWLFYHPEKKWQLRVAARAEVLAEGSIVEDAWQRTSTGSRRCYLSRVAPGEPLKEPHSALPPEFRQFRPSAEESESGRKQFVVLQTSVLSVDFLELDAWGHRRCCFSFDENGAWQHTWLAP